jgi:hypothetical protein
MGVGRAWVEVRVETFQVVNFVKWEEAIMLRYAGSVSGNHNLVDPKRPKRLKRHGQLYARQRLS